DRPRHLPYIDDLILVGTDPEPLRRLQSQYIDVITSKGLPAKRSKVTPPTCTGLECLGLEIDGQYRTVGLSVPKMQRLLHDTRLLLARGSCTGPDMAHIV